MTRTRVSTTVDADLLAACRARAQATTDAQLFDDALRSLLAAKRRAEFDAAYEAYERVPLDAPDEWGDMASFLDSLQPPKPSRAARTG